MVSRLYMVLGYIWGNTSREKMKIGLWRDSSTVRATSAVQGTLFTNYMVQPRLDCGTIPKTGVSKHFC